MELNNHFRITLLPENPALLLLPMITEKKHSSSKTAFKSYYFLVNYHNMQIIRHMSPHGIK